ncbi:MAG: HEAT repeat domain-containing protein [Planctomycetes bacterium]|nr:HEAT repeat domain-containing protein [Planctomycetota bacterium]
MIRAMLIACLVVCLGSSPLLAQAKFLGKGPADWAQQLKAHKDAKQRRGAAFALGKLGWRVEASFPAIKAAYAKEQDTRVKEAIVYALGEICRDVKSFYNSTSTTPATRQSLVNHFEEICLGAGSRDRDLEQLLIGALGDDDKLLRRSAAFALGCLASKSAATRQALDKALGDAEPMVRQNAAWGLAQFREAALLSFKKALGDSDSLVKRDAASALLLIEDGEKVHDLLDDLLPLCENTDSEVRRAALNVLVRIVDSKDTKAIGPLTKAMRDNDIENKRNAALALSNIGGEGAEAALGVLLEAAKSDNLDLRRQAVLGFRNLGKDAAPAVPELTRLLRDDADAQVRKHAALSLGGIGPASEPAVQLIVQKIQDPNEKRSVRVECAMALARIGKVPSARDVVPTLLAVLRDKDNDARVRERVMWSLRVHAGDLRQLTGVKDVFMAILDERLIDADERDLPDDSKSKNNKMLRYDCAYMLGMVWQSQAPPKSLDRLYEFLCDKEVKVYKGTGTGVAPQAIEGKSGQATVKEEGIGDGRTMATAALEAMGAQLYGSRADIVRQLRVLAAEPPADSDLAKAAKKLLAAAGQ